MKLRDEEKVELRRMHTAFKDRQRADKIKTILLLGEGYTGREIATILLIDEDTITTTKRRFMERKTMEEWLETGCKGYKGKLTKLEESDIQKYVNNQIVTDSKQVRQFIQDKLGKIYSKTGVVDLLHRLGFVYKKTCLIPAKYDSREQAQFKNLYDDLSNKLKEDEVVVFMDGMHPQHNTKCSYAWIKKGEEKRVKSNSGRKRLNISGAYNPFTQEILTREDSTINYETVIEFFKEIENHYCNKVSIYAITDQASYYKNQYVSAHLETSRIKLILLPTYSPNLNLIERLWKLMRQQVINNVYYEHFKDFKKAVLDFFQNDSEEFRAKLKQFIGFKLHLLDSP